MDELQKAYLLLQENCGIKVGDKVKVLRKAKSHEGGWDNCWSKGMDDYVGKTLIVHTIGCKGIRLEGSWNYPFFVLEKLDPLWTDKLCEDVPALCYVSDSDSKHGILVIIREYNENESYPFTSIGGIGWEHAELVPKELLQAIIKRYYD